MVDEWYKIGYVPYKLKDKVYKDFYEAVDAQFAYIDKSDRRVEGFQFGSSLEIKYRIKIYVNEKDMRQYERKNELQTYENNMGFLSVSPNGGIVYWKI